MSEYVKAKIYFENNSEPMVLRKLKSIKCDVNVSNNVLTALSVDTSEAPYNIHFINTAKVVAVVSERYESGGFEEEAL